MQVTISFDIFIMEFKFLEDLQKEAKKMLQA